MKLKKYITLFLLFSGCATAPNFVEEKPQDKKTVVYIYSPDLTRSMWAKYKIYFNDIPVAVLKNGGYFSQQIDAGKIKITSHHVQDESYKQSLELDLQENKSYFIRLNTQLKEVTLASALSDVVSVSTAVAGIKSEVKLKEGNGSLKDVHNYVSARSQNIEKEREHKERPLGFHSLDLMNDFRGLSEIKKCSSTQIESLTTK